MASENEHHYSPLEAVALLEPIYRGTTKTLIAEKLKDGLIRSFAERIWSSNLPTLDAIWTDAEEDGANAQLNVSVDKMIYRRSRYWNEDISNWRWDDSRFVITRRKKAPADRTIILGVRLMADDIDALMPTPKNKGGAAPEYQGWGETICALIQMHADGKLNKTEHSSMVQLANDVESQLSLRNGRPLLQSETIRKALPAVWKRFFESNENTAEDSKSGI